MDTLASLEALKEILHGIISSLPNLVLFKATFGYHLQIVYLPT